MRTPSKIRRALLGFALTTFLGFGAGAAPVTLEESYRSALQTSESVGIAGARRDQAQEDYRQARGGILPNLSASAGYAREGILGSGTSAFQGEAETSAKLTLRQPLFRGLREFAGLRAADALLESADLEIGDARQELYRAVADAYYGVLAAERDRAHLQELYRLTGERLKELRERERIGRSRRSEVMAAESRQEAVAATIRSADAVIATERESFARITRLDVSAALAPPPKLDDERIPLGTLESYLAKLESRFDIRSLRKQVEAADEGVSVAWGAHLPELDVLGNYHLRQPGVSTGTSWDLSLTLTLPLFSGGIDQSNVRESAALRREAELRYEGSRREAGAEIRTLHRRTELLAAELRARERAVSSAEKSYQTHQRDYRFGLATNLEVLEALNSAVEARRERDRTFHTFWATLASLEAATASVPAGGATPGSDR